MANTWKWCRDCGELSNDVVVVGTRNDSRGNWVYACRSCFNKNQFNNTIKIIKKLGEERNE